HGDRANGAEGAWRLRRRPGHGRTPQLGEGGCEALGGTPGPCLWPWHGARASCWSVLAGWGAGGGCRRSRVTLGTGAAEAGGHALRSTRNVTRGLRRETGDGSARLRGLQGLWGVRLPRGTARQRCHHVQAAPVGGLCLRPPAQELSTEEATRGRLGAGFLWGSPGAAPGPCRAGTETDWGGQRGGAGAGARCRPLLAESAGLGQARLPRCSRCPARGAWCPSHSWRAVRGTRPGALLTEPPSPGRAPVAAHGCGSGARHGDGSHGLCVLTCPCPCPCPLAVPSDLTPEECQELENIRRRKQELLADIQRLKDEIAEVTNEIENLGSTEERKNMQRNKQVAMGRKKFNMDPKKGIQFLIENDLLKNTCEDIAQFLYKGEGLNKTAIGDYLGERDEFNIQVLHAFVELHEFTDLNLVQALRQFLWSFRLPGEAQKIDRMMEAFAQRYCQCNPGVFQSTDTCYVLSFAIIMLNTSLHNPNVKDKPTAERFIAMNRGINDGGDLPEELLRNLYESIKNEPFKIPEDDGNDLTHTFFNPDREGWLLKLGGRVKTWKRRWFILTDNCLYYFEYTTDKEPRGIIPLENLSIREVEDSKKPNCFELYIPDNKDQVIKACKTEADGRVVEGNHTVYRISAPTPEEKEEWIKCIK
uniref:Cytohesin 1 n=1 Tax=Cairina moschata TaxID=8855 RepID=A0A8C3CM69_CAIMO